MQEPWDACVCASVRTPRACVCVCACLWTHLLLPCSCSWSAGMWALGQGDHRLSGPQLSLCPLPFLAPEEAEGQSLPSEGQLRLRTTGLVDPHPVFPSPPSICLLPQRPITRQLVQPFSVDSLSYLQAPALWVRQRADNEQRSRKPIKGRND